MEPTSRYISRTITSCKFFFSQDYVDILEGDVTSFSADSKHLICMLETLSIKPALQSSSSSEGVAEKANRCVRTIFTVPKLAMGVCTSVCVFEGWLPVCGSRSRTKLEPFWVILGMSWGLQEYWGRELSFSQKTVNLSCSTTYTSNTAFLPAQLKNRIHWHHSPQLFDFSGTQGTLCRTSLLSLHSPTLYHADIALAFNKVIMGLLCKANE